MLKYVLSFLLFPALVLSAYSQSITVDRTEGCGPLPVHVTANGGFGWRIYSEEMGNYYTFSGDTVIIKQVTGSIVVEFFDQSGGIYATEQAYITVNPFSANLNIHGPTYHAQACPNEPMVFEIYDASDVQWQIENVPSLSGNMVEYQFSELGTKKVRVSGTASCGYFSRVEEFSIVDTITPVIYDVYISNDSICPGEEVSFQVNTPDEKPVSWDFGDGTTIQNGSRYLSHIYNATGEFTVRASIVNSCGNTGYIERRIYVGNNVFPPPPIINSPDSVCPNEPFYLNTNNDYSYYSWYVDGKTYMNEGVDYSYPSTGNKIVSLTIKNKCNNSSSNTKTIVVNPNLIPEENISTSGDEVCPGEEMSFWAGDKYKTVEWYFSDGSISRSTYTQHSWEGTGSYNVIFTGTNYCNNTVTVPKTIRVSSNVGIRNIYMPEFPFKACINDKVRLSSSGDQFAEIAWQFGDGASSKGEDVYHSYSAPGSYYPSVTFTNYCGFDTTISALDPIVVRDNYDYDDFLPSNPEDFNLVGGWDGDIKICPNEDVFFENEIPGVRYTWDFGDGATKTTYNQGVLLHSYPNAGIYYISLTAENGCGDTYTIVDSVEIGNRNEFFIPIDLDDSYTICPGDYFTSVYPSRAITEWEFGDGSEKINSQIISIEGIEVSEVKHKYLEEGVYTVRVKGTDFCMNTDSTSFKVNVISNAGEFRMPKEFILTLNETQTTCYPTTFMAEGGSSYVYNFGDGNSLTTTSPLVTHTYESAGIYEAFVSITTGCQRTYTTPLQSIVIDECQEPVLVANFGVDKTSGEGPLTVTFENNSTSTSSTVTYQWDFNNDGTIDATLANPSFTYNTVGTYSVKLIVSDGTLSDTLIKSNLINVFDCNSLSADFNVAPVCLGSVSVFQNASSVPAGADVSFEWDFNNDGVYDHFSANNASYPYTNKGLKPVKLRITSATCKDSIVKNAEVQLASVDVSGPAAVCETDSLIQVSSTVSGSTNVTWSTRPSIGGTFKNSDLTGAVYRISFGDRQAGSAKILLAANAPACPQNKDSVIVVVARRPVVDVGPNQRLSGNPVAIDATVMPNVPVQWFTTSSGSISPGLNSVDITYTPSAEDIQDGIVRLVLTTVGGVCPPVSNRLTLSSRDLICNVQIAKNPNDNLITFMASNADNQTVGSYLWDFGDGNTASGRVQSNIYNQEGDYIVKLSYSSPDSSCIATAYDTVSITSASIPTYTISGNIKAGINPLDTGKVTLFKFDGYHYEFLRAQQIGASNSASYSFAGLENGYYLIHSLPAQESNYFEDYFPTYYGNAKKWEDGLFIQIDNDDVTGVEVSLVYFPYEPMNPGLDIISGTIVFDAASINQRVAEGSEESVENAVITLYNASGDRLTSTYTDPFGSYSFEGVGAGEYTVDIEYAGTEMSQNVRIDATGSGEELTADGVMTKQEVSVGIKYNKNHKEVRSFNVYPNPANSVLSLVLPEIQAEGEVSVRIYNVTGVLQKEFQMNSDKTLIVPVYDLTPGLYIVDLQTGSEKLTSRFTKQ